MRIYTLFILALSIFSCGSKNDKNKTQETIIKDNQELIEIYEKDQNDRSGNYDDVDWNTLGKNDSLRRIRVHQLIDSNKVGTSLDYKNAAMIFQHGLDSVDYGMAVKLMTKSVELDTTANKWLLAAAIDRYLLSKEEPQIYGTQYYRQGIDKPWQSAEMDSTKISDQERIEYGVPTLAEQRERVRSMNRKKLSELVSTKPIDEIIKIISNQDPKNPEFDISESGINRFGYNLMNQEKDEDALKIFRLNTELYPQGFNSFDSYAECLLKTGDTLNSIVNYKKSLELNPNNDNAKKVLKNL